MSVAPVGITTVVLSPAKGAIDFIRRRKKKTPSVQSQAKRMGPGPGKKKDGGMANAKPKKFKAGGLAKRGLGKAYMNSKR